MKQSLLLGAALVALPLTAALAQVPASLTPDQIVAARQAGFVLSGGDFAAMKAAADSGADVRQLAFGARAIARWARTIPTMFPAGTNLPSSHALPAVWSDRAGFEARAAAYAAAAQTLAQAAQSGDREAFLARWTETRATCGACHDQFKSSD